MEQGGQHPRHVRCLQLRHGAHGHQPEEGVPQDHEEGRGGEALVRDRTGVHPLDGEVHPREGRRGLRSGRHIRPQAH